MREYVVEGLGPDEVRACEDAFARLGLSSGIDGLHWLEVPEDLLSPLQREHLSSCGPYAAALETDGGTLRLEMLVRARGALHCACIAPATPEQEAALARTLGSLLADLGTPRAGSFRDPGDGPAGGEPRP